MGSEARITQAHRQAEADAYRLRRWEDDDVESVVAMILDGGCDIWTSLQERALAHPTPGDSPCK
jgi:hypothetical protein